MLSVEILSGGESEGGSVEETVCQETQTPRAVSNSHGDMDKSVVRSSQVSNFRLVVSVPYTRGFINVFSAARQLLLAGRQSLLIRTEYLYMKTFPPEGQTRQAKSSES